MSSDDFSHILEKTSSENSDAASGGCVSGGPSHLEVTTLIGSDHIISIWASQSMVTLYEGQINATYRFVSLRSL